MNCIPKVGQKTFGMQFNFDTASSDGKKYKTGVSATIFTPSISRTLNQDLERHNA